MPDAMNRASVASWDLDNQLGQDAAFGVVARELALLYADIEQRVARVERRAHALRLDVLGP